MNKTILKFLFIFLGVIILSVYSSPDKNASFIQSEMEIELDSTSMSFAQLQNQNVLNLMGNTKFFFFYSVIL
jgi:hypothetical protein